MVDNFFVQYRQWSTIFLCNRVMLLLLLLNIVDIVVLKTRGFIFLVLTTIQTMVDNFFVPFTPTYYTASSCQSPTFLQPSTYCRHIAVGR